MQLNDHGLFAGDLDNNGCKVRIMDNTSTEKQVFDMLGLVWREPHEPYCIHAVIGAKKKLWALQLEGELELDKSFMKEFREAEQQHTWINLKIHLDKNVLLRSSTIHV